MVDELLLILGQDIIFSKQRIIVHQPRLKELSVFEQKDYLAFTSLLAHPKRLLDFTKNTDVDKLTDFDVILLILNETQSSALIKFNLGLRILLSILFDKYELKVTLKNIKLLKDDKEYIIDNDNYSELQVILNQIFCLKQTSNQPEFNPQGAMASRIAEKLRNRHKQLAQYKSEKGISKVDVISRRISILTVGLNKDINVFNEYTIYQLFDEYERFMLAHKFDLFIRRACSFGGVSKNEKIEDWMKDLDSKEEDDI